MAYRKTELVATRQADRRQRILRAARRLIAEGGFHQAPVAAVAELAGVATGTVYRYFPSKSSLFAETVAETSQRELEVVAATAMHEGTARERLAAVIEVYATRALQAGAVAYALVAEPVDPEVDAIRVRYRRAFARVFETIVAQGVEAGEFGPQDAAATAACLVGACNEGLAGPLAAGAIAEPAARETRVAAIVRFCLAAVTDAAGAKVTTLPVRGK
jgi:AcrR family transcriptional regulator